MLKREVARHDIEHCRCISDKLTRDASMDHVKLTCPKVSIKHGLTFRLKLHLLLLLVAVGLPQQQLLLLLGREHQVDPHGQSTQ